MPDRRKQLGDFGERAAAAHLERQGMLVLERKWRCPAGELDLVLRDGVTLVFAEVRTRRAGGPSAEESVGPGKRARLIGLAYAYCEANSISEQTPWRIDVVAVEIDRGGRIMRIAHIPSAVEEQ
ncbi:MAG: YraN family protein [Roseiflexaceae bacterium]